MRGLAAVKVARNDAAGALADLARASALQSETPDARLAAQINLEKGRALHLGGRLTESQAALQQARGVFKSADSAAELVSTDDELAVVAAALGEWRAAYAVKAEAAQQQEQLLSRQLDQRFAILKVEYDSAAQEQENRALLRENAATGSALAQSRRVRQLQGIVIALGVALGAVLIWLVILNRGRARRMGSLAMTDELTQAPNRRAVLAFLSRLLKRPEAAPCAILIMDIDFFKRINDQHGHAAGDEVLKLVAAAVRDLVTAPAFFGRLGGEEFLIVLPDADLAAARRFAEALRQSVAAINTRAAIPGHAGVTTSVGLTVSMAGADDPGRYAGTRRHGAVCGQALGPQLRAGRTGARRSAPGRCPALDCWKKPWCWKAPRIRASASLKAAGAASLPGTSAADALRLHPDSCAAGKRARPASPRPRPPRDHSPAPTPARHAAPSAVLSACCAHTTGAPSRSAWNCMSRASRLPPPSTRNSRTARPESACMAFNTSVLWKAMASRVARAICAAVVPRVSPTSAPRACGSQ